MSSIVVRRTWLCTCTGAFLVLAALALLAPTPAAAGIPIVQPAVCRGAGFWSTHAGNEKGGTNMVQALLEEVGCLEVCGEVIDETDTNDADSAEEGLCVAPKSGPQIQLARLLLTQAMNCIISTGAPDCDPEAWAICNDACANPEGVNGDSIGLCRAYLDCQSNGGTWDFKEGACFTGTCQLVAAPVPEGDGGLPCGPTVGCPDLYTCVPTIGCDDADLLNESLGIDFTDDEQQASSSKKCNQATKTRCAIVGPNEPYCTDPDGNESDELEECPECTEGFVCGADPVECAGSAGGLLGCFCFSTAEGGATCIDDQFCDGLAPCSSTSECLTGESCIVDSCCSLAEGTASGFCFPNGDELVCAEALQSAPVGAGRTGTTALGKSRAKR